MAKKSLIIALISLSFIALSAFGVSLLTAQPAEQSLVLPTLIAMPLSNEIEIVIDVEAGVKPPASKPQFDITLFENIEEEIPASSPQATPEITPPADEEPETLIVEAHTVFENFVDTSTSSDGDSSTDTGTSFFSEPIACRAPITDGVVLCLESDSGVISYEGIVTAWEDQSASGNHLSAIGEPQLILNLTSGGLPGIRFDGINDALENTMPVDMPAGNTDRTIFTVVSYDSIGSGGFVYGSTGGCNQVSGLFVTANGHLIQNACNALASNVDGTGTDWMVQSLVAVLGSFRHYRDGIGIHVGTHNFDTVPDSIVLGASLDKNPFVNMNTAAVLVYDRALNETERNQVEMYLQYKYLTRPFNEMPLLTPISDQSSLMNSPVSLQVIALDVDTLAFGADGLPAGLNIDTRTGLISGIIAAPAGTYPIRLVADDTVNFPVEIYFNWTVIDPNRPPNEAPIADAGNDIIVFDSDANGTETVTLDGTNSSDDTGIIDSYEWRNALDTVISSAPTVAVTVDTGTTQIFTLTVFDADAEFNVVSVSVTVTDNEVPVVTDINEQTGTRTNPAQLQIVASDTDVLSYTASGLPDGLSINPATGFISGTITAIPGTYSVIVTVSDNINLPVEISFNWIVLDVPQETILSFTLIDADLNQVIPAFDPIPEGAVLNLALLPDNLSIIANTNPPQINGGVRLNLNDGATILHTDQAPYALSNFSNTSLVPSTGSYTLTATSINSSLTLNFTVINNNVPVANAGLDITINDNDGNGLETITLDGSGSNDDTAIVVYEWRTNGSSTILANSAIFDVTVSTGITTFELTVYDAEGESHTDTVDVTLLEQAQNDPPVITNISAQTDSTGASVNLQIIANDMDSLNYSASGLPDGLSINPATGLISGTVTASPGNYPVTLNASDTINPAVSANFNWIITAIAQADILSFTLLDTDNGTAIPGFNPIVDGATLNLETLPPNLTIIVNTNPVTLNGGVNLNLNNGMIVYQETVAPYSLAGNTGGIYNPVTLSPGMNTLTASSGIDNLTLTFTVSN